MKNLLIITMLLGIGYANCNESNWQEYYPNMQECYLVGANLFEANLSGAYLIDANLSWANLYGADLSYADLSGAYLIDSNLCNLTGSPNGDVCEQPDGITDEDGDGYDDVSYESGAESGDINLDGSNDVLDVVLLTNCIILDNCDE